MGHDQEHTDGTVGASVACRSGSGVLTVVVVIRSSIVGRTFLTANVLEVFV